MKKNVNIWLRSCEREIDAPIEGAVKGTIPLWLKGSLLRNGPGKFNFGDDKYKHLFDAAALLHRFNIANGKVTYQCKFLKSESYKKNLAANRIVVNEFATVAAPDPCQSIFSRY
jgi:carotenoid isomerooxygenase